MESIGEESIDMSPMELLPTEILAKILSYLPVHEKIRLERVCKRWKNVSTELVRRDVQVLYIRRKQEETESKNSKCSGLMDSSKKFDKSMWMKNNQLYITADELGIIENLVSRAGQHVKKFTFNVNPIETPAEPILSIITADCHNIEVIQFFLMEKSAVEVFSKLLIVNKKLHSISCVDAKYLEILPLKDWRSLNLGLLVFYEDWLSYANGREKNYEEKLVALIDNSPSLETFRASECTYNMLAALKKCKGLKTLCFSELIPGAELMKIPWHYVVMHIMEKRVEDDPNFNPLHHCLNLEVQRRLVKCYLQQAVLDFPELESLTIDAKSLTDEILGRWLKFKHLRIENCSEIITENGIFQMIMNSECLEELEIPQMNVTVELFKKLVRNTKERRKILKIDVNTEIYEEALQICEGSKIHIV